MLEIINNYPCIFSPQVEAIVHIFPSDIPQFQKFTSNRTILRLKFNSM